MTINIGLITSDALILGCDSVSSITQPFVSLEAFIWKSDESGKSIRDENGNFIVGLNVGQVQHLVTDVYGGVTKMFKICHSPTVVAVTAGLAKISNRTIKALADDFCSSLTANGHDHNTVKEIADAFILFVGEKYDAYTPKIDGPFDYRAELSFLIGGFGRADDFPSLYVASVKDRYVHAHFEGGKGGIAWNGQSDAVERLIRGYDVSVRSQVDQHYAEFVDKQRANFTSATVRIVNEILEKLGADIPDGINLELPPAERGEAPWNGWAASIDYDNMPLQDGIDFVSLLVNLQSGKQKFARGIATVGGRTHIGIVTKAEGFRVINPPELVHKHTGFGNDL